MQSEQAGIATFWAAWIRVAMGDDERTNAEETAHRGTYRYHSKPEPYWSCSCSIQSSWYIAKGIQDRSRSWTSKCPYSKLRCHSQKIYCNQVNNCTLTFKVSVEQDSTQHKTNERECTVKLIQRKMHRIPQMRNRQKPMEKKDFLSETAYGAGPL